MIARCDWYCFECHTAGDVEKCKNCYRVFHRDCSTKAKQSKSSLKCFEFDSTNLLSLTSRRKSLNFMNVSNPEYEAFHVQTNSGSNQSIYDINLCSICNMMLIYSKFFFQSFTNSGNFLTVFHSHDFNTIFKANHLKWLKQSY